MARIAANWARRALEHAGSSLLTTLEMQKNVSMPEPELEAAFLTPQNSLDAIRVNLIS